MQVLQRDRTLIYVGVVSAFFVALLVGWFAATASAFPLRKGTCDAEDTINYRFEDDVLNWTAELETTFNQASDNWDLIDDANGNTITDVKENDVRGAVPIELVDTVSLTICNGLGNPIAIQMDGTLADTADFKGVTVHEIGHVIGLDHTGQWDSFDSDETTMTGCAITNLEVMLSFEQDDAGNVVATFNDADLHANPSWEDTGNWTDDIWGAAGGSTLVNRSEASSPKGTRHGEIQRRGLHLPDYAGHGPRGHPRRVLRSQGDLGRHRDRRPIPLRSENRLRGPPRERRLRRQVGEQLGPR